MPSGGERFADERDGRLERAGDERGGNAKHAVAGALQELISLNIEVLAPEVHFPIDVDDEEGFGADEVSDVAADDHLTTEREAEAAASEGGPEALLGERGVVTKVVGLRFELELACDHVTRARG